jgi:hypothetical protein
MFKGLRRRRETRRRIAERRESIPSRAEIARRGEVTLGRGRVCGPREERVRGRHPDGRSEASFAWLRPLRLAPDPAPFRGDTPTRRKTKTRRGGSSDSIRTTASGFLSRPQKDRGRRRGARADGQALFNVAVKLWRGPESDSAKPTALSHSLISARYVKVDAWKLFINQLIFRESYLCTDLLCSQTLNVQYAPVFFQASK